MTLYCTSFVENEKKNNEILKEIVFHLRDFTEKKNSQNPLVLFSRPFVKFKKFPYEGLFPFDRFPFHDYELYLIFNQP